MTRILAARSNTIMFSRTDTTLRTEENGRGKRKKETQQNATTVDKISMQKVALFVIYVHDFF